jgi:hypothetical protein
MVSVRAGSGGGAEVPSRAAHGHHRGVEGERFAPRARRRLLAGLIERGPAATRPGVGVRACARPIASIIIDIDVGR